jgi:hypothetical protein
VLSNERCDARGSARGGSPELSLELALTPSLQVLPLHDLQRTGVLTYIFTGIGEVGCGLAMRKRSPREMVSSGGVLVVLLRLRFLSRLWWRSSSLATSRVGPQGVAKQGGRWGESFLRWGKGWNQWFDGFPIEINFSVASV